MELLRLTSVQNPKIKSISKLRDRRARDKQARFLIEGYRELTRAVQGGQPLDSLYVCFSLFLGENEEELISKIRSKGIPVYSCSEKVFRSLSYRDRPDGLIAIGKQRHLSLNDLKLSENPFFIVAESIEKPGNLGTILRSADAAGAEGVIVCDRCTDIYNPNVVRASIGTLFTQPVVEAPSEETLMWLKNKGIAVVAATPSAKKLYTHTDLTKPLAIVVGSEQYGLSEKWLGCADTKVCIPMRGKADSLNVATATTLLLYEVLRQREIHG